MEIPEITNAHPETVCIGDGTKVTWEEYQKMKGEKDAESD